MAPPDLPDTYIDPDLGAFFIQYSKQGNVSPEHILLHIVIRKLADRNKEIDRYQNEAHPLLLSVQQFRIHTEIKLKSYTIANYNNIETNKSCI